MPPPELPVRGDETLKEEMTASRPTVASHAWLIHVGSPENGFLHAGTILPLDGIRSIRFGRGGTEGLSVERVGSVLHLSIMLGWVSSAHAELRVVKSSTGLEFDLRDLGSRNGTHIERRAVPGIARLQSGQLFEIGRSFWMVRALASPEIEPERVVDIDPAGTSNPRTCATHQTLARLAKSDVPILLVGETGTGKGVTARAVHRLSGRDPFVVANLAALSDDTADRVLFGDKGLFARAAGGTLYLDELGELSPNLQSKLLAAIAERRAEGSEVRLIASTLRNLHELVQQGDFRPDLYSRLAGYEAHLGPLRSRREDLGVLTRELCQDRNGRPIRVGTRAMRRLLHYPWPYNVRELGQTLATASILAGTGGDITRAVVDEILERRKDMPQTPDHVHELRAELVDNLHKSRGDTAEVAKAMARQPTEIHRWLERFELEPEAFRR